MHNRYLKGTCRSAPNCDRLSIRSANKQLKREQHKQKQQQAIGRGVSLFLFFLFIVKLSNNFAIVCVCDYLMHILPKLVLCELLLLFFNSNFEVKWVREKAMSPCVRWQKQNNETIRIDILWAALTAHYTCLHTDAYEYHMCICVHVCGWWMHIHARARIIDSVTACVWMCVCVCSVALFGRFTGV